MGNEEVELVARASISQQSLWLHDQVSENRAAHHVTAVIELSGPLDAKALEASLVHLSARHEALRTAFRLEDDQLLQVVLCGAESPLDRRDIGDIGDIGLDELVASLLRQPFDLGRGRLWRVHLLRFSPSRHLAVLAAHHLVIDAVSSSVLLEELGALYAANARRAQIALPDLPIQYADFSVWQREQLDGGRREQLVDHWRSRLAGALPLDPHPLVPGKRTAALVPAVWDRPVGDAVAAVGRAHDVTPFMVVLACYAALLGHRYGRTDVSVLTPVDGRSLPELERVVGYFIDVLPIRVTVNPDQTFGELLAVVRESALTAFSHQDLSLESIATVLREVGGEGADRVRSGAMLAMQQPRASSFASGDVEFRIRTTGTDEAKADLALDVRPDAGRLLADVEFDTRLFSLAQVSAFADDLALLVEACSGAPAEPLGSLLKRVSTASWGEWRHAGGAAVDRAAVPVALGDLTATQRVVAESWAHVFGRDAITADADFFDFGGQSLDAVRIAAFLKDRFGVELSVSRDLHPDFTVAAVAARVDTLVAARQPTQPVGPPETAVHGEVIIAPASVSQEGMWAGLRPGRMPPVVLGGLAVSGPLDLNRLVQAVADLALRHEVLRSTYRLVDGQLSQIIAPDPGLPVTVLPVPSADRFAAVVRDQLALGFDLDGGALARLVVLRIADDDHILFLMMHHLIGDGRSVEVVLRDTLALYLGDHDSLPPLPVPFRELARRHRQRLDDGRRRDALRYWVDRLAGAVPVALPEDLNPADTDAGDAGIAPGRSTEVPVPHDVLDRVTELAVRLRSSVNAVGLSAFLVVLARSSGQRDLVIRTPVSYRDELSAQDVVADFSNDFVLRVDLSGDPTWSEVITRVTDRLTADLAFHDLPPHLVAPHLDEPGLLDRLFQVQFTTEDEIVPPSSFGGLRTSVRTPLFPFAYRALSVRLRLGVRPHTVWIHRSDVFSPERITALAESFNEALAQDPADRPFARRGERE